MPEEAPDIVEKKKPRKKRKFLRFVLFSLLFLMILLVVGAFLLNGSLGRYLLKDQAQKHAQKIGLTGDFTVGGTLLTGHTLSDVDFTGTGGIQTLKVDEFALCYDFRGLLNKEIQSVELSGVQAKLDLSKFPKSEKEDDDTPFDLQGLMATIRPWVVMPKIGLEDVDLELVKNDAPFLAFQWDSFNHETGSDEFYLQGFAAQNAKNYDTSPQDVTLTWNENGAEIDRLEVIPGLAVQDAAVDWEKAFNGGGIVEIGESTLKASIEKSLSLELIRGSLATKAVEESIGIELPVQGSVDALDIFVSDWKARVPDWDLSADLHIVELKYGEHKLTDAKVVAEQKEAAYKLSVDGSYEDTPAVITAQGQWTNSTSPQWWGGIDLDYTIKLPKVGDLPQKWLKETYELDYTQTSVDLVGQFELAEGALSLVTSKGTIKQLEAQGVKMPTLHLDAGFEDSLIEAKVDLGGLDAPQLAFEAAYQLEDKEYEGALKIEQAEAEWVNALIKYSKQDLEVTDPVSLEWRGKGAVTNEKQKGFLQVDQLALKYGKVPELSVSTKMAYDFPQSISVARLAVDEGEWSAKTSLEWDGTYVKVPSFTVNNGEEEIAKLHGSVPYNLDVKSLESFLAGEENLDLTVQAKPVAFEKVREWTGAAIPEEITGEVEANLVISGSPSQPRLDGVANLLGVEGLDLDDELNVNLFLASKEDKIGVVVNAQEGETNRFSINSSLPFTPLKWIESPAKVVEEIKASPLQANLDVKSFPVAQLAKYVPQLESIEGVVTSKGGFSGSINEPKYSLSVSAEVPLIELKGEGIGDIKDVVLNSVISEDHVISNELSAVINGGRFTISGDVDIKEPTNPIFDLTFLCKYGLIYRDDLLSTRTNAALNLTGTLENAKISGSLSAVESLVYKDLELIPIGVPSSAVAKVNLPSVSSKKSRTLPIPEPFGNWTLDVNVSTEDPILIRGNLASGNIDGSMQVRGTLKEPAPNGVFKINNTKAILPFSTLHVDGGEIIFTTRNGILNPKLKIPGTSKISGHNVNLLVYGDVSNPQTSLTSSPPLPEPEIMSLLGTGSTTSSLENRDAVALKALQIFLLQMKDRKTIPGGRQLFGGLASLIDTLNLQVGQNDTFTGRTFTSANVDLTDHWIFTTQVDDEQRARGLLVYLIRFK